LILDGLGDVLVPYFGLGRDAGECERCDRNHQIELSPLAGGLQVRCPPVEEGVGGRDQDPNLGLGLDPAQADFVGDPLDGRGIFHRECGDDQEAAFALWVGDAPDQLLGCHLQYDGHQADQGEPGETDPEAGSSESEPDRPREDQGKQDERWLPRLHSNNLTVNPPESARSGGDRFTGMESELDELGKAVEVVVGDCLEVGPAEEVLVVANPATVGLGEALRRAAGNRGAEAVLAVIAERDSHAGEPPATVAEAMVRADVLIAPTVQSLSHTAARKHATESGTRTATLPGVTTEMLSRVMSEDMEALRDRGSRVAALLDRGTGARITCDHGSDLKLDLEGRAAISDAGELGKPGAFGNLPCGEGFISPASAEGTLVVDGTLGGIGMVEHPVRLEIREGRLVDASGPQGAAFMDLLLAHGIDGTNVAELGIGTNTRAILTGNVLEDEKIAGTAHVAFGASAAIGGNIQVPVHLDVVSLRPEVTIDDTPVTLEGKLLV